MNMKNLAGNPVSIFLFRFVIHGDGISFEYSTLRSAPRDTIPKSL